jgi:hypothetical protein
MPSKKTAADRFLEFAATVPPMPTSLLASAHSPVTSAEARRAARLMVGGLASDEGRIARIARNLDKLVEIKRARSAPPGSQRRGVRK